MPGPFPGMDPYIEAQGNWQDFHNTLIAELRAALGMELPDNYVARVDERIEVVDFDGPDGKTYRPDVLVARDRFGRRRLPRPAGVATMEPMLAVETDKIPEEIRVTWLEVRRLPDLELVTVVEVLSPVNKAGMGHYDYLAKRRDLLRGKVNLVEIDLLLRGERLDTEPPLILHHYVATVARGTESPKLRVYGWSLDEPVPTIKIPLREPDPDVPIDLQPLVDRVYDLGRYGRTLRYDRPLPSDVPLSEAGRAWCEGRTDQEPESR